MSPRIYGCATPGGWVTPKKLVLLGVLGLADCTPGREPRSVAASSTLQSGADRSTPAFSASTHSASACWVCVCMLSGETAGCWLCHCSGSRRRDRPDSLSLSKHSARRRNHSQVVCTWRARRRLFTESVWLLSSFVFVGCRLH